VDAQERLVNYLSQAITWLNDPLNWTNPGGIFDLLRQHLEISALAVLLGCLVALPLGLALGHFGRGGGVVVLVSNVTRAIPTLAVLSIFPADPGDRDRHDRRRTGTRDLRDPAAAGQRVHRAA
jgi:ABC-type phosphate/phosphonate transport system permease subunit